MATALAAYLQVAASLPWCQHSCSPPDSSALTCQRRVSSCLASTPVSLTPRSGLLSTSTRERWRRACAGSASTRRWCRTAARPALQVHLPLLAHQLWLRRHLKGSLTPSCPPPPVPSAQSASRCTSVPCATTPRQIHRCSCRHHRSRRRCRRTRRAARRHRLSRRALSRRPMPSRTKHQCFSRQPGAASSS